ncbi:myb/SANT-like DNA-binding domain-containing protein 1 [Malaclemys terrapin pileata]|uniref:myb/SANT-like DNA-binding domain-containing protein 1 n=1 Tax=Malaclemys terrapin pileata TaxID=2991368 RepID=UPI0023A81EAD|nr:myb/SANT-like DNA-binding domain-containing protein 1 [Malaclemys terrapin pileata]
MEIDANSSGSYPTVHHSVDALDSSQSSDALTSPQEKPWENLNSFSCLGSLNLISCLDIVASSAALATMQSSPAEMAMQSQNRKRAPAWTDREILDLIAMWGDESVLSELRSRRRNAKIYEKISKAMTERGYSRDATQCRVKIKELRQGYQKTKEANGRSGSQPQTCHFYEALHSILGAAATTTPPLTVDSEDVILSTPASSEMVVDGEEEEGDEEDEAVDSTYNADFPDSQDLHHPHRDPVPTVPRR